MNLSLFNDNLCRVQEKNVYSLSDYIIAEGEYKLYIKKSDSKFLLTAQANERSQLERLRLTVSKLNENGNKKSISDSEADLFRQTAKDVLMAYTYFENEKCDEILNSLLPFSGKDFEKTAETRLNCDNYTLIFYSNDIACQLMLSCDFLYEYETTEKPTSKPSFDITNLSADG